MIHPIDRSPVFLIVEGLGEVRRGGARIRELGVGEFFGEVSILDPAPRTATVRAMENSLLLVLEGSSRACRCHSG